jgi:hemoglobin
MHSVVVSLLVSLPIPANWGAEQDRNPVPALSPRDIDIRLDNQLYETLKLGTTLYNAGNSEACFRLYQGSLIVASGFLGHRPQQQRQVQEALRGIETLTNMSDRAHALRKAIDDLRLAFRPVETLWERLGGEGVVTALIDDALNRALADPKVNFTRKGSGRQWEANPDSIAKLKKRLVAWISSVTGGPLKYEGQTMPAAHAGMKISEEEFSAFVNGFKMALEKQNVSGPTREELLKVLADVKSAVTGGRSSAPP